MNHVLVGKWIEERLLELKAEMLNAEEKKGFV
jgi:hypothetical protein